MGSKTINVNKLIYATSGILLGVTLLAFLVLTSSHASADATTSSATASVNVSAACTMSTTDGVDSDTDANTHTATLTPGAFTGDIGLTNVTATCNDPLGYTIYAIGYSNNTYGNTSLIGPDDNTIAAGTSTSGDTSNWSMKLGTGTGDSAAIVTTPTNYTTYAPVPETYTKVATYANGTTTRQAGTSFATTYGVYTSPSQPAGTYTGAVRYTLVHPHNAIPQDKYYMQDFTTGMCEVLAHDNNFTVYDRRDESDYAVRYINGQCWMTQNLRITGTISAIGSNFSGNDFNVSEYSLDADDPSYTNHCDNVNSYNYACAKDSGSTTTGAWYNYYAASAGTIATNYNAGPTIGDICPAGWHLPSGPNTVLGTDLNILIGNADSGWQKPTTGLSLLEIDASGYYSRGSLVSYTSYGYLWSSTPNTPTAHFRLDYRSGDGWFRGDGHNNRYVGNVIRCLANNS